MFSAGKKKEMVIFFFYYNINVTYEFRLVFFFFFHSFFARISTPFKSLYIISEPCNKIDNRSVHYRFNRSDHPYCGAYERVWKRGPIFLLYYYRSPDVEAERYFYNPRTLAKSTRYNIIARPII